ncbi:hypothetical protein [Clostridium gasigenes]|nr:hypothetical protein [Clostridium gasigenes]MBU3102949.1 hypothetical protein [Clostridium gasigenes]
MIKMKVNYPEDMTEIKAILIDKLTDFALKNCTQKEIDEMIRYYDSLEKK